MLEAGHVQARHDQWVLGYLNYRTCEGRLQAEPRWSPYGVHSGTVPLRRGPMHCGSNHLRLRFFSLRWSRWMRTTRIRSMHRRDEATSVAVRMRRPKFACASGHLRFKHLAEKSRGGQIGKCHVSRGPEAALL